jgi:hypothetical protein
MSFTVSCSTAACLQSSSQRVFSLMAAFISHEVEKLVCYRTVCASVQNRPASLSLDTCRFGKSGCFDLAEITIVAMPKRNLRVTKWLGTIPAIGVCTFCDRLFYVPLTALKKVADAQESLRVQFTEHKCKTQTDS